MCVTFIRYARSRRSYGKIPYFALPDTPLMSNFLNAVLTQP
nr:MAG TPA: hypothetical protein [Bacteriophage sp.]